MLPRPSKFIHHPPLLPRFSLRLTSFSVLPGVFYPINPSKSPSTVLFSNRYRNFTHFIFPNKCSFSVSPFFQTNAPFLCPPSSKLPHRSVLGVLLIVLAPCAEPWPLPPSPHPLEFFLCDYFLPSILIFTPLLWSPDLPSSCHPGWLSAFLPVLPCCGLSCLLPTSPRAFPASRAHLVSVPLVVDFATASPPLGSFSSLPVGPPLPGRRLYFRRSESVTSRQPASPGPLWTSGPSHLLLVLFVFLLKK